MNRKFIINVLLIVISLKSSMMIASENNSMHIENSRTTTQAQLIKIGKDYLTFVHDVGSEQSVQADDKRLEILFAQNLTKIDNRTILFKNSRQSLLPQMKGFETEYKPELKKRDWSVDVENALIIPSIETNSVIVYFEWTHINIGSAITNAILQCNNKGQIERIIDVWAKVK